MITQTFKLNLIPTQPLTVVACDQYDVGTGRLIAKLYEDELPYTPSAGATALIQGKKPDGHGFMYDATISGNTVTADLTEQMTMVAGDVRVQIVINETNDRTGTFVFTLRVQPSALPSDTDMSRSEYQVVEELLETAISINSNFPYIGPNGHWWYWDVETAAYVDSGVAAGTSITIGTTTTLDAGDDATVTNTGDNINAVFNFGIPKGEKGDDGDPGAVPDISMTATADAVSSPNPSVNVTKTGTDEAPNFALAFSGLKGAQGVQGEEGPEGPAGNGIVSITKTGTSGLVDTYTILFTNGQSTTFTVTNGQDGTGSGDMTKAVYDPNNVVANAGGIPAYIGAYDFDAYLKLYNGTVLSGADLDKITTVGTYIKTASGLKAGSPSDIVANDKYILIVMNAATNKNLVNSDTLAGWQMMIAHIAATDEIKIYLRGYAGYTGEWVVVSHWTDWVCLTNRPKVLTSTLTAGNTTVTFTDASITATSRISVFTDIFTDIEDMSVAGTTLTLTFPEKESNMVVQAVIQN